LQVGGGLGSGAGFGPGGAGFAGKVRHRIGAPESAPGVDPGLIWPPPRIQEGRRAWGGGRSGGAKWHGLAVLFWQKLLYAPLPFGPVNPGMVRTVHLGYRCNACCTRVPVYTFTRSNGNGARSCTPPVDRNVECPTCHARRQVAFAEIQSLERWEVAGGGDHLAARTGARSEPGCGFNHDL
jgi:hypothetical protein